MKEALMGQPTDQEFFRRYFPEGQISVCTYQDLPQAVLEFFESKNKRFKDPKDYKPKDFSRVMSITHQNGDKTYAAVNLRVDKESGFSEEDTYLYDINPNGEKIGHGEIRRTPNSENKLYKNHPFVGFTHTEKNFKNKGFGKRRIKMMNALTQMLYRQPLNSSTYLSYNPESFEFKIWEGFVKSGDARYIMHKYSGKKLQGYVFN